MRKRRVYSIKRELIVKSREAALSAVQIFNNPLILFKSESFIVLMIIAWTYLMHAYYRDIGVDYKYYKIRGKRKSYDRTSKGALKYWELERCINDDSCPLLDDMKANLRFLIGLRHEIEHQMTSRIDDLLSARFQATCLNYNTIIKIYFGEENGIDKYLSFSLQFSSISKEQKEELEGYEDLPTNIKSYIHDFDESIDDEIFNSPLFAYRVLFTRKLVNHRGQADSVIEFVNSETELSDEINKSYVVVKEKEKLKYKPRQIVDLMQRKGYANFTMNDHTQLWKEKNARNRKSSYGVMMGDNQWYWYQNWVDVVEGFCKAKYREE